MARNSEKAMTALARWRAAYVHKYRDDKKRPFHTIECEDLKDAIIYRRQVVLEMTKAITSIQNPSLSEYKLRDLNDEINKLIKEKNNWEDRIVQLGGPDYKEDAPKLFEKDGKEAPGYRGYRYFGAARDLPGVRELFEEEPQPPPRKTRGELMKFVDIAYYGNCDEDDGVIIGQECIYEANVIEKKISAWKRKHEEELSTQSQSVILLKKKQEKNNQDVDDIHQDDENIYDIGSNPIDEELNRAYGTLANSEISEESKLENDVMQKVNEDLQAASGPNAAPISSNSNFLPAIPKATIADVAIYTQEQIEESLVNQKKEELLRKYVSVELMNTISEARTLLGHETKEQSDDKPKEVCGVVESLVQKKRIIDANKACTQHPLYDDSADEDQYADEDDDMEDLD